MNKTTLFLIMLIVPLAHTQQDVLNLLDKTPEGKEVLNHLFIQTKLMGPHLDVSALSAFVKKNLERVEEVSKEYATRQQVGVSKCNGQKAALKGLLHNHVERHLAGHRRLEASGRLTQRATLLLERGTEEHDNYNRFASYATENKAAWNQYYNAVSTNFKNVESLLERILEALHGHKGEHPAGQHAFVELPGDYDRILAEIKLEVESSNVDYTGMGPILNNFLEIMQDKTAAHKVEVREHLAEALRGLLHLARDKRDALDEENQYHVSFLEQMEKTLHATLDRSQQHIQSLQLIVQENIKEGVALKASVEHAEHLAAEVSAVVDLRHRECDHYLHDGEVAHIKNEKVKAVLTELMDVLASRSEGVKAFFIQREMKKLK